jgi:hypothetical protein
MTSTFCYCFLKFLLIIEAVFELAVILFVAITSTDENINIKFRLGLFGIILIILFGVLIDNVGILVLGCLLNLAMFILYIRFGSEKSSTILPASKNFIYRNYSNCQIILFLCFSWFNE